MGESLEANLAAPNYNGWLYGRARPFLGRRLLDVGAGIGTFAALAAEDGQTVLALEPNARYAEVLKRRVAGRSEVEVVCATIEDLLRGPTEPFDAAICFNVLEHISNDASLLRGVNNLLVPGGHLLLLVPAHPVLYSQMDRQLGHVRRYRRAGVEELLRNAGYETRQARYVNPIGALGWLATFRLRRAERWPRQQHRAFDAWVPALRHLDRIPFPVGLSVWAVARRPLIGRKP